MPNYTYKCRDCERVEDIFHGMTESPTFYCTCRDEEGNPILMHRVITGGSGVIYKASRNGGKKFNTGGSWDWASKRPDPTEGHRITKEQKAERARQVFAKMEKSIDRAEVPNMGALAKDIVKQDIQKGVYGGEGIQ
jgi:predicted nucleic acid-binding Zn ribbon protein